jgi:hypothetical protein
MHNKTWRDVARPIIASVIRRHRNEPEEQVRKALREAYPWGERAMWPYKVWCSEVRRQLGTEVKGRQTREELVNAGQMELPLEA